MADLPLHQRVYLKQGSCSCRACGLEWKSHTLEPCPRCNEGSLHAEAVKLQERLDTLDVTLLYIAETYHIDVHAAHANANKDEDAADKPKLKHVCGLQGFMRGGPESINDRCEACEAERGEEDPTVPQQHPDNGGIT